MPCRVIWMGNLQKAGELGGEGGKLARRALGKSSRLGFPVFTDPIRTSGSDSCPTQTLDSGPAELTSCDEHRHTDTHLGERTSIRKATAKKQLPAGRGETAKPVAHAGRTLVRLSGRDA